MIKKTLTPPPGQSDWKAAAAIPEDTIDDSDFNWDGATLLPKGAVTIVPDFLPPPEALVARVKNRPPQK